MLHTDIANSGRLVGTLGEQYDDLMREVRRRVRDAVERNQGHVVDDVGDSVLARFDYARPALAAAADAQRAMVALDAPGRIGVHTGEARVDDAGVRGLTVYRIVRVCGAAHAGQVVVSSTTEAVIEAGDAPELRPLGSFVLKDFDRPVPLYQLVVAGIENDFPPLRIGQAGLPAGTVTLVFSDVERSTELLRELRGEYADVIAEHRRLLREAYDAHGGHVVDTEGDATSAGFRRAAAALAAAADAQRALAGLPVRIRMGVNTGEPDVADDRYIGLAVNRAARICAAAHGDQVLVSEATAMLALSDELPGVTLVDRGLHTLKDFNRPERLFQLEIDGLPSVFPPPRAQRRPRRWSRRR
jgi:class 3 adenylate cyclase